MDTWSQDPRRFLLMHLKLRRGVQFSHESGKVQVSLPGILEPTSLPLWQYRIMLGLDGEDQFISIIKNVRELQVDEFDAGDVWQLLYWLIEKDLLDDAYRTPVPEKGRAGFPRFFESAVKPAGSPWLQVPMQLLAVIAVALGFVFATHVTAPIMVGFFKSQPSPGDPIEEMRLEAEEIKATRLPQIAPTREMEVAGAAQTFSQADPIPAAPQQKTLPAVEKLLYLKREIEASQIRRDACYLLNNEEGYQQEVERITQLAREIGDISLSPEP